MWNNGGRICIKAVQLASKPHHALLSTSSNVFCTFKGPQAKHFPAMQTPMLPNGALEGRTVLITGGGTGLGKGMAQMFSHLGANVAIASRRLPVLESTAEEISNITGKPVLPIQMDVRNPEDVSNCFDKISEKWVLPDIVVNNAAGNFISPTVKLSSNAWKTIIDIVLNGTANVTLEAGKRMIQQQRRGVFLAITARYTQTGSGYVSPSASAKVGVETLTKSLSSEWGKHGIRLNCIAPGPVETEGAFSRLDPTGSFKNMVQKRIPAGRMGEVEEIANLASFLVSDYSSWISGESIGIDGGEMLYCAGEFNLLDRVPNEQWDMLEKMIRKSNQEQKKAK